MTSLKGELIWIIGASSGIGRALAVELAGRGATLALSSRSIDKLGDLTLKLSAGHTFHAVDVVNVAALKKVIDDLPRLPDRVIYMAGQYEPGPLIKMDPYRAAQIVAVNLTGALNLVALILPLLVKRGHGQIALTASVAGYRGLPNAQPYGSTKAALINLAQSLDLETRGTGIDVKLINPGFVRTEMTAKNDFTMPMIIEADEAARAIADGLVGPSFEIHFPKKFTWIMKILSWLPRVLYRRIVPR